MRIAFWSSRNQHLLGSLDSFDCWSTDAGKAIAPYTSDFIHLETKRIIAARPVRPVNSKSFSLSADSQSSFLCASRRCNGMNSRMLVLHVHHTHTHTTSVC